MIKKKDLKRGWYKGKGRNADIAYWTGSTFLTIGKKFGKYVIKDEGLKEYAGQIGFGCCFMPEERIADSRCEYFLAPRSAK